MSGASIMFVGAGAVGWGGILDLDRSVGGGGFPKLGLTLTDLMGNELKYFTYLMQFTIASFEHSFHEYRVLCIVDAT